MLTNAPSPICPLCKHTLDPKKDILWDNTGGSLAVKGIGIVYCGWCGAVLGATDWQTLTKRERG